MATATKSSHILSHNPQVQGHSLTLTYSHPRYRGNLSNIFFFICELRLSADWMDLLLLPSFWGVSFIGIENTTVDKLLRTVYTFSGQWPHGYAYPLCQVINYSLLVRREREGGMRAGSGRGMERQNLSKLIAGLLLRYFTIPLTVNSLISATCLPVLLSISVCV